ncbi:1-acyl-sn-glycerol-3-phosphate acyltransferase, partial [bacterium]|nr:1-acyl-sn-glycerol-3-phosphate acyltransferase [bacterium]
TTGLPLARYNDAITLRRWMKWKDWKKVQATRYKHYYEIGPLPNASMGGHIYKLINKGESILLSLGQISPLEYPNPDGSSLVGLIKAAKESPKPVYVVPQQFIWDKRPGKARKTLIDILFGERIDPGTLRRMIMFWRNYRSRANVRISHEIDLKEFIAEREGKNVLTIADELHQKLQDVLKIEREVITGPLLKPRSWIIEEVMEDPQLRDTIYRISAEKNKNSSDVKQLAHRYIKEIAADIKYSYIEFGNWILNWFFNTLFDNFIIDEEGLKQVKAAAARSPIVFVPNHRSHIDYLLMSYILYKNNITVPHVASGINLAFFPLGHFFRKCGAYFLRRSFEGNMLYKAVFSTYIKILVQEGYPQEFFIEGGRSRTGKLLNPRLGMISMITKAIMDGAAADLTFIPVSICYDRVIEQKSYKAELMGDKKKNEKTKDLFRLHKYLKGRYGQIYVNFGEPISVKSELDANPDIAGEDLKNTSVLNLANNIMHSLNKNAVVTPSSLIATSILTYPHRGILRKDIFDRCGLLSDYLDYKNVLFSGTLSRDYRGALYRSLLSLTQGKVVTKNTGLSDVFYSADDDQRISLDYHKNTIIHYFISASVLSHVLLKKDYLKSGCSVDILKEEYEGYQRLLAEDFKFGSTKSVEEHVESNLHYFVDRGWLSQNSNIYNVNTSAIHNLTLLKGIITNYIESYYAALDTVQNIPVDKLDEKTLIKAMLKNGHNIYMLGKIKHPEAISQPNLKNAIIMLRREDILQESEKDQYTFTDKTRPVSTLKALLEEFIGS